MSTITHLEKRFFEDMFGMVSGYVLDFTNDSFTDFFNEVAGVKIDDLKYCTNGSSKAKRLRRFWETEPDSVVGKILGEMLSAWAYQHSDSANSNNLTYASARKAVARLLGKKPVAASTEADFLNINFSNISISKLQVESALVPVLEARLQETKICLSSGAYFAAVLITGSLLEGLLLACALNHPQRFNQTTASPKDAAGKVRPIHDWKLAHLIDVACEVGALKIDVKKFSHSLRDFRNYIHPYAQMSSGFMPDEHTAKICLQVLRAAIADLCGER